MVQRLVSALVEENPVPSGSVTKRGLSNNFLHFLKPVDNLMLKKKHLYEISGSLALYYSKFDGHSFNITSIMVW